MKLYIAALLVAMCSAVAVAQPTFKFTEGDYAGSESDGFVEVEIIRTGIQSGPITVNVKTLTKQQYEDLGYEYTALQDPAEVNDPVWDDDFAMKDFNVTFLNTTDRREIHIPIFNDDVDEEDEEAFIVILDVVEASEPYLIGRNVTVGLIVDDDDLIMTWEIPSVTVSEVQGSIELYVAKQDGMLSERVIDVNVDVFSDTAFYGQDFKITPAPQNLVFNSSDKRLPVEVMIIDDNIHEGTEQFTIDILVSTDSTYTIGRYEHVLIIIKDNDDPPTQPPPATTSQAPQPSTTPTGTGSTEPEVDCPGNDVAIGITFLITFLLTFLITCLLAAIICAFIVAWDRKRRATKVAFAQLEQQQQQTQQTQN